MTYTDDMDLCALERAAYQRGDWQTADLIGAFLDAQEDLTAQATDSEKDRDAADEQRKAIEGQLRSVQSKLDTLYDMVKDAARVSNRQAMLDLIISIDTEVTP